MERACRIAWVGGHIIEINVRMSWKIVAECWTISVLENQHQYAICHFPLIVNIIPSVFYCLTLIDVDPVMHIGSLIP